MPKQLSVVCPQCKQGLTINFESRKMAITCPDCQKLFRIGSVVDPVVAKRSRDTSHSGSSVSDQAHSPPSYKRPTGRLRPAESWEPIAQRTREFVRRQKPNEMSAGEESLQAGGYFMMVIAILGSLLPAIDFEFGQIVVPPIPCMILCFMAGIGGVVMILIANLRHNLPVAIAWASTLAILALMIWVLCFDISRLDSPFRYASERKSRIEQPAIENQNPDSSPQNTLGPKIRLKPAVSSTPSASPVAGSGNAAATTGPNEKLDPQLVSDFEPQPPINAGERSKKDDVLPSEKKLDDMQRQFGSEGTARINANNFGEIQQELEMRFKDLNQTSILGGVAQSHSFNKEYVLSSVLGKQTNFGDALYDGRPLRGIDVSMARKNSGMKYILPILDKPKFSNSLYEEGYFLTGLNVHVNAGRLAGLQCVVTKGTEGTSFLDESDRARTPWRGAAIKGPSSVSSGDKKVYGLVTYTELDRIVGIQLILKR